MPLGFAALTVLPVATVKTVNQNAFTANSVAAASSAGSIADSIGKANHTPTDIAALFSVEDLNNTEGKGNANSSAVSASFSINPFAELIGLANHTPTSVTAAFTLDAVALSVIASANFDASNIVAQLNASAIDFDAEANITTSSVVTPSVLAALESISGKANTDLFSVSAEIFINTEQPTAVTFPYELYKDDFDRFRTIYIVEYGNGLGDTVFVTKPENTTVFIAPQDRRKTVFIDR